MNRYAVLFLLACAGSGLGQSSVSTADAVREMADLRSANTSRIGNFVCRIRTESYHCESAEVKDGVVSVVGKKLRCHTATIEFAHSEGRKGILVVADESIAGENSAEPKLKIPGRPELRVGKPVPFMNETFIGSQQASLSIMIPTGPQATAKLRGPGVAHAHQTVYFGCYGRELCTDQFRTVAENWAGQKLAVLERSPAEPRTFRTVRYEATADDSGSFVVDEKCHFATRRQTRMLDSGKFSQRRYFEDYRQLKGKAWLPFRFIEIQTVSEAPKSIRAQVVVSTIEDLLEECPKDHKLFYVNLPAGMMISDAEVTGKFYRTSKAETVGVDDLPGMFAKTVPQKKMARPDEPLPDPSVNAGSSYKWWWLAPLPAGLGVLLLRRRRR